MWGECIDMAQARGFLMGLLLAARDTTAIAMAWMTYLLAVHKDVQAKLYQEAKEVLGDLPICGITYDHIQRLHYTHAVMMEVRI